MFSRGGVLAMVAGENGTLSISAELTNRGDGDPGMTCRIARQISARGDAWGYLLSQPATKIICIAVQIGKMAVLIDGIWETVDFVYDETGHDEFTLKLIMASDITLWPVGL